ncbi:MAG: hypothetical protein M3R72_05940 [Bacteroidota bacterium]|nr:hypothetical protein [Bacteroidota bacterium]
MDYEKTWKTVSYLLDNPVYLNDYSANPAGILVNLGITDPEEQAAINDVLVPTAEFRQVQVNTFKQLRDYDKKIAALTELVQNPQAAAAFEASPEQVLVSYGFVIPQEQQELVNLLQPVKQFQQLAVDKRADSMDYNRKMECLKNLLQPNERTASYVDTPQATYFASFGITDPQDQAMLSSMLQPARELQKLVLDNVVKQTNNTADVIASYQQSLAKTNRETVKGFSSTMLMYQVSFYAGIALLVTAVVCGFIFKSSLFSIVFGSIGTLDLLTFFIANPPLRLQESRAEHTKLNAAFYSWFVDLFNWNAYFLQYSQKGQEISFEIMKQVSDSQIENTRKLMDIITNTQVTTANATK